ncbi:MAG: hypothetical protein R2715_22195 [Ilumatobacteraceae bacterium]
MFDLADAAALLPRAGEQLLDDGPVHGVVDVAEHVEIDGSKRPWLGLGVRVGGSQLESRRGAPPAVCLAVQPVEVVVQQRRAARRGVDPDPEADASMWAPEPLIRVRRSATIVRIPNSRW